MAENQQPRGRAHSRCGNGGPGKSWKCPNPTFPRFPPPLEIPHKTRDSHIPTAPATADRFHTQQRKAAKIEEFYRFSLRTLFRHSMEFGATAELIDMTTLPGRFVIPFPSQHILTDGEYK